jgi:thiol-disulfide isomerase/thioredoxin
MKKINRPLYGAVAGLALAAGSLALGVATTRNSTAAPAARATTSRTVASKAAPVVTPVTAAALKKQIAARRGKVVLVNFWATWCEGCRKEFPDLVRLQKNYAKRGVSLLYVSGDETKDRNSKVVPFLRAQGVTSPSYIIQGDVFTFIPQFDPKLKTAFGLPRTYVYDRSGKLIKVAYPEKSYAEFEKIIKPLL